MNSDEGSVQLLIYVDDIILASSNLELVSIIKSKLMSKFKMKDKGDVRHFLGLEIYYDRDSGVLKLSQSKYTKGILKRFNMDNCKGSFIPIDPKLKLNLCNDVQNQLTKKPYREMIGCLMYLMLGTRPDICYALNYFSRFSGQSFG